MQYRRKVIKEQGFLAGWASLCWPQDRCIVLARTVLYQSVSSSLVWSFGYSQHQNRCTRVTATDHVVLDKAQAFYMLSMFVVSTRDWRTLPRPQIGTRDCQALYWARFCGLSSKPQKAQLSHLPWRNWLARSTVRFAFWHLSYREVDSSSLSGRAFLLLARMILLLEPLLFGLEFLRNVVDCMRVQRLHSPRCSLPSNLHNGFVAISTDGDWSLTVWSQDCQCWNCPSQAVARPYDRRL